MSEAFAEKLLTQYASCGAKAGRHYQYASSANMVPSLW